MPPDGSPTALPLTNLPPNTPVVVHPRQNDEMLTDYQWSQHYAVLCTTILFVIFFAVVCVIVVEAVCFPNKCAWLPVAIPLFIVCLLLLVWLTACGCFYKIQRALPRGFAQC
jgi:uncharacterized integral membrane protein